MARRRLLPLVLLLPLLGASCGGGSAVRVQPLHEDELAAVRHVAVRHVAVPDGYRRHAVREAGISVALPIGWQVLGQHDASFPGALQNLTRLHADFFRPIAALSSPDSPLKLFGFERGFWHGHATTMMVSQATYRRPGAYSRWAPRIVSALARAQGRRGPVAAQRVDLPAGPALRAAYQTRTGDTVVAYVVAGGNGLWALTFRTPTAHAGSAARGFARTATTLELSSPLGAPVRQAPPPPA